MLQRGKYVRLKDLALSLQAPALLIAFDAAGIFGYCPPNPFNG